MLWSFGQCYGTPAAVANQSSLPDSRRRTKPLADRPKHPRITARRPDTSESPPGHPGMPEFSPLRSPRPQFLHRYTGIPARRLDHAENEARSLRNPVSDLSFLPANPNSLSTCLRFAGDAQSSIHDPRFSTHGPRVAIRTTITYLQSTMLDQRSPNHRTRPRHIGIAKLTTLPPLVTGIHFRLPRGRRGARNSARSQA